MDPKDYDRLIAEIKKDIKFNHEQKKNNAQGQHSMADLFQFYKKTFPNDSIEDLKIKILDNQMVSILNPVIVIGG